MKKRTKIFPLFLCLTIVFSLLAGCRAGATDNTAATAGGSSTGTHTVTDNGGKKVKVPNKIDRIVILDLTPLPSVYCMLAGSSDRIVGMTPTSKNVAVNSLLNLVAPELKNIQTDFASSDSINTEELLKLHPDVIFYGSGSKVDIEAVSKLNIPAVGFSASMYQGSTIKTLNSWAQLMADVLQDDKISTKAQSIIKYGEDTEKSITGKVSTLSNDKKTSAVIVQNYNSSGITIAGNTFGRYYLKTVGAKDVASSLTLPLPKVNMEQIYKWNPSVIFLNSFTSFSENDIYNSTAGKGDDWSGLTAIKTKRVYKLPIGMYYWYPPCSDSPLALQWIAKALYPDLFKDVDMNQLTKEYYSKFYGINLTDSQLKSIFNPSSKAAYLS